MDPLARLFGSPARLKLLRLFIFNSQASFTLDSIALRTKITKEAARGELSDLVAAGVVKKKITQKGAKFCADTKFLHFSSLDAFIRETSAVQPKQILTALKKAGSLRLVVLSGMFIGLIEPQVDLVVVGDALDDRALARAVAGLEADLGREIRYASFKTQEFRYRRSIYDRLLRDVFDYEHHILLDKLGL